MSDFQLKNGMKLYYEDVGSGEVVVMMHGWTSNHGVYAAPAELLKDKARVITYDHRGHGGSKGASGEKVTMETLASDLHELIEGLSLTDVTLVGWSMGAATVMGALGEKLPENVCCAAEDCGYENLYDQLLASTKLYMPKLPFKTFFTNVLDLYCRLFRGFSIRLPLSRGLERCTVPVLFIHGSSDGRFSITYAVRDISRAEIEGVGFRSADYDKTAAKYDPAKLSYGYNTVDGEEVYFIPNPALGLWIDKERFEA